MVAEADFPCLGTHNISESARVVDTTTGGSKPWYGKDGKAWVVCSSGAAPPSLRNRNIAIGVSVGLVVLALLGFGGFKLRKMMRRLRQLRAEKERLQLEFAMATHRQYSAHQPDCRSVCDSAFDYQGVGASFGSDFNGGSGGDGGGGDGGGGDGGGGGGDGVRTCAPLVWDPSELVSASRAQDAVGQEVAPAGSPVATPLGTSVASPLGTSPPSSERSGLSRALAEGAAPSPASRPVSSLGALQSLVSRVPFHGARRAQSRMAGQTPTTVASLSVAGLSDRLLRLVDARSDSSVSGGRAESVSACSDTSGRARGAERAWMSRDTWRRLDESIEGLVVAPADSQDGASLSSASRDTPLNTSRMQRPPLAEGGRNPARFCSHHAAAGATAAGGAAAGGRRRGPASISSASSSLARGAIFSTSSGISESGASEIAEIMSREL